MYLPSISFDIEKLWLTLLAQKKLQIELMCHLITPIEHLEKEIKWMNINVGKAIDFTKSNCFLSNYYKLQPLRVCTCGVSVDCSGTTLWLDAFCWNGLSASFVHAKKLI